ncbi:hypothetical protein ACLOJK_014331 [Asimina triloba]
MAFPSALHRSLARNRLLIFPAAAVPSPDLSLFKRLVIDISSRRNHLPPSRQRSSSQRLLWLVPICPSSRSWLSTSSSRRRVVVILFAPAGGRLPPLLRQSSSRSYRALS